MTYNATHRKPPGPSRWGRVRAWLADMLDRLRGPEWHHGLTDQEVAEEFGEDEWRSCPCGRGDRYLCPQHGEPHGLTDDEVAEEFPEDMPRPGTYPGTRPARVSAGPGPGHPWEPPDRQVVTAILKDGVHLVLTGGPPVDLRKYLWEPRICARRNAPLAVAA